MNKGSRKAFWTTAHHNISGKTLVQVLDKILDWRGAPQYIRCDNGPELISHRLRAWSEKTPDRHQVFPNRKTDPIRTDLTAEQDFT